MDVEPEALIPSGKIQMVTESSYTTAPVTSRLAVIKNWVKKTVIILFAISLCIAPSFFPQMIKKFRWTVSHHPRSVPGAIEWSSAPQGWSMAEKNDTRPETKCTGHILLELDIPRHQLGNQIFRYASLYGIASRNSLQPYTTWNGYLDVFRNLSIPIWEHNETLTNSITLIADLCCAYFTKFGNLNCNANYTIGGLLQSWRYFEHIKSELKREFQFRNEVVDLVKMFRNETVRNLSLTSAFEKNQTVEIGIHIRRGDYLDPQYKDYGLRTTSVGIVAQSVQYILENVRNGKSTIPIFYVISNDVKWCEKNLKNITSNLVIADSHLNFTGHFELLKSMDIIVSTSSASTFAWWAAYLSSKVEMVLYDPVIATPYSNYSKQVKKEDFIYPSWIPLKKFDY